MLTDIREQLKSSSHCSMLIAALQTAETMTNGFPSIGRHRTTG